MPGESVLARHFKNHRNGDGHHYRHRTLADCLYKLFDKRHADRAGQKHVRGVIPPDRRRFRFKATYRF